MAFWFGYACGLGSRQIGGITAEEERLRIPRMGHVISWEARLYNRMKKMVIIKRSCISYILTVILLTRNLKQIKVLPKHKGQNSQQSPD